MFLSRSEHRGLVWPATIFPALVLLAGCAGSGYTPTPGCTGNKYEEAFEYVLTSQRIDSLVTHGIERGDIGNLRVSARIEGSEYRTWDQKIRSKRELFEAAEKDGEVQKFLAVDTLLAIDESREFPETNEEVRRLGTRDKNGIMLFFSTPLANTLIGEIAFVDEGNGSGTFSLTKTVQVLYYFGEKGCVEDAFSRVMIYD